MGPAWDRVLARAVGADARSVRRRTRRLRRRRRPACGSSCASPGSAARGFSSASTGCAISCSTHRPTLGPATCRACCGRRHAGRQRSADGSKNQLLLRLPRASARSAARDHRRLGLLSRRRRCGGRGAGRGSGAAGRPGGRPSSSGGTSSRAATTAASPRPRRVGACSRSSGSSICPARRSRTSSTGWRWISTPTRYDTFADLFRVLPPGRLGGRTRVHQDLRVPQRRRVRVRVEPRRGAAVDQHSPGHQGRSRPRPGLPPARGSRGARLYASPTSKRAS